jgi:hypothetical protein
MTMDESPRIAAIPSRLLLGMVSDKVWPTKDTAFFEARNLSFLSQIAVRRPPLPSVALSRLVPCTSYFAGRG